MQNKERRESASSSKEKELPSKPEDKDPPPEKPLEEPTEDPKDVTVGEPTEDAKDVTVGEDVPLSTSEETGGTQEGDKETVLEESKEPQDTVEVEESNREEGEERQQQETSETQTDQREEEKKEDPVPEEKKEDPVPEGRKEDNSVPDAPQNNETANILFKVKCHIFLNIVSQAFISYSAYLHVYAVL